MGLRKKNKAKVKGDITEITAYAKFHRESGLTCKWYLTKIRIKRQILMTK